jgi:acyl-CoA synthetase (AMP-forming)/AMP-acid ligase II
MVDAIVRNHSPRRTLLDALRAAATISPEQPALLAPGRTSLSHAQLVAQCARFGSVLAELGVTPEDRVAMVMPNGPETAAAFLGITSHATCAPLNPAYKRAELEWYMGDIQPKLLVVDPSLPSGAVDVARALGIAVLPLIARGDAPAGVLALDDVSLDGGGSPALPGPQHNALILHTSGTTSRPKMVALTQANLLASVRHIAASLQLSPADRCLNCMPLFHIHGLMAGLLVPVLSAGSTVCPAAFDALSVLGWLETLEPSWLTAVPTMYEALATTALGRRNDLPKHRLRFMRSSSASLAPTLMAVLEELFGVPVIESYGMTEAAHQMASNPLPPRARKPGSVGPAAGPEVAIMDPLSPTLLPRGAIGEIVIRGANVTSGYLNNAAANASSFAEGWFRTGDQGYLDTDGYVFISGRLKEMINRGGEKISPREIDEALLAIAGVRQAVTFAIPHPTLGEDIAAALVLKPGLSLDEPTVRKTLSQSLAEFKVPARVLFLAEIPKGPTGKVQRIGLAERLASLLEDAYVAPRSEVEQQLAEVFQQALQVPRVGVQSNFFALGGDSLAAIRVASLAAQRGLSIPSGALLRELTIERLAPLVSKLEIQTCAGEEALGAVPLHGFQHLVLSPANRIQSSGSSPSEVVLELTDGLNEGVLDQALRAVARHHDAFGLRFVPAPGRIYQNQERVALSDDAILAIRTCVEAEAFESTVKKQHESFDLSEPPLFRVIAARGTPGKVAVIAHHLVSDALSMQVVSEDLAKAYEQAAEGAPIALEPVATPFSVYTRRYGAAARSGTFQEDVPGWLAAAERIIDDPKPRVEGAARPVLWRSMRHIELDLSEHTERILSYARTQRFAASELLLAVTAGGLGKLVPSHQARIVLLHNGRDDASCGDLSRTVGCLTTAIPLHIDMSDVQGMLPKLARVQEGLRALPGGGRSVTAVMEHGPMTNMLQMARLLLSCRLMFNYKATLGARTAMPLHAERIRSLPCTYAPRDMLQQVHNGDHPLTKVLGLQIHAELADGKLFCDVYYSDAMYTEGQMNEMVSRMRDELASLPLSEGPKS